MLFGAAIGGIAGYAGGAVDELLSRFSDFVLVLPAIYVVARASRGDAAGAAAGPRSSSLLAGIFALVGWPVVARGVRGIIASEREREYVTAGRAARRRPAAAARRPPDARRPRLSARPRRRCCCRHSSSRKRRCRTSASVFRTACRRGGRCCYDASNVALVGEAPWMLAPAAAIFLVVLAVNLVVQGSGRSPVQLEP